MDAYELTVVAIALVWAVALSVEVYLDLRSDKDGELQGPRD